MFDSGGWGVGLWLMVVIDVAAVVLLGVAIRYATRMWQDRPQDLATLSESDNAARRLYHPVEGGGR